MLYVTNLFVLKDLNGIYRYIIIYTYMYIYIYVYIYVYIDLFWIWVQDTEHMGLNTRYCNKGQADRESLQENRQETL